MARNVRRIRSERSYQRHSTGIDTNYTQTSDTRRRTFDREEGLASVTKRKKRLGALGRGNCEDLPYSSAVKALEAYSFLHGDLVIPRHYIVPSQDPFPEEWHGVNLATNVYCMKWWQKHVKSRPERVEQLNKLGFVWQRLQPEWNLVLESLITFSALNGHIMVPSRFVVPFGDDEWPEATWGVKLGSCVRRIRDRNDFLRGPNGASRRDQLDGLGFVWDVKEHIFHGFYQCLHHYAKLHECGVFTPAGQHHRMLKVPINFVVPRNTKWPEAMWDYPLGIKCQNVREKQLYVKKHAGRKQALEELGFVWSGNADLGWLQVVHAAAIYSRLHNRTLAVPQKFVVPAMPPGCKEEWPWPEYLWGLPLGTRLKDVRTKSAYLKGKNGQARTRQLETLGFVWQPRRGRPKTEP